MQVSSPQSEPRSLNILLIEDHPDVRELLQDYFVSRGHALDAVADAEAGLPLILSRGYDVLVLDRMLPGLDGASLCRQLRETHHIASPILMLTALATPSDRVEGLNIGADDYLVKPFDLSELEARVMALARRANRPPSGRRLVLSDLSFDLDAQQVRRGGHLLNLTPMGRHLLEIMMRNAHRVVRHEELERAMKSSNQDSSQALRVHIHALRAAIDAGAARKLVHTVRGAGYRISDLDDDAG